MARVLILLPSATYRAPDFLAAAARLGAEVVVASDVAQTIEMGDRALVLPLDDPGAAAAAIVASAGRHPLDAVVAVDDQGVLVAALAGARLGLAHNPPAAVAATRDKAAMRTALAGAAGVLQPAFTVVAPGDRGVPVDTGDRGVPVDTRDRGVPAETGADVAAAAVEIGFPCVVKPVSLSASRGVIRADDPAQAAAAGTRARAIVAEATGVDDAPLVVERYVAGTEVAVEALLRGGHLEVLAIFDKPDPLTGPYFEETLYVTPSRLPAETRARVVGAVAAAAAGIGLVEGPVHAELRIDDQGETWLLEVAARSIGGLCSRSLRFGMGVSLEELILRHALGLPLDPVREAAASGVMMLPIPAAGRLVEVRGQDEARAVPGIEGLEVSVLSGRPVRPLPEGDRYLGFLFARAATPEAVEAALRTAHACLDVVIDPA
ncbi:MAG: ATP-grasp domain-containing protein [Acidimicrobiia bacterium]